MLMAAMSSIALFVGREIRDRRFASTLVEGPWQPIRGMIENGVWKPPKDSIKAHPSFKARHATPQGDDVPGT